MKEKFLAFAKSLKYPGIYIFYGITVAFLLNILVNINYMSNGRQFDQNAFLKFVILVNGIAVVITYKHIIKRLKAKNEHLSFLAELSQRPLAEIIHGAIFGFVLALGITAALGILNNSNVFPHAFSEYQKSVSNIFDNNFTIIQLICIIFLIPAFEEFIFRGLMMEELKQGFKLRYAILIQSIIFALTHGEPIQMIYGFILGIAFSILVYLSGSLWTSVASHIIFNTTNVILYFIDKTNSRKFLATASEEYGFTTVMLSIFFIGIIAFSIKKLKQKKHT